MVDTGIVNIRGKQYETVALRVQKFREQHPNKPLLTEVIHRDVDCVVVKATIADENGQPIATGHAEEYRATSQINKTSALENAETSAIGRALAAFGLGGTEFASANEVQNAIHQQGQPAPAGKSPFANAALRRTFAENVRRSFESAADLAALETVASLNEPKFAEMKQGGNEHDLLLLADLWNQYQALRISFERAKQESDNLVASYGQGFASTPTGDA